MAQFGVDPLCRLKLFLNAEPILTEPVTAGGARELQAGREGGGQVVLGHRWKGRSNFAGLGTGSLESGT